MAIIIPTWDTKIESDVIFFDRFEEVYLFYSDEISVGVRRIWATHYAKAQPQTVSLHIHFECG